VVKFVAFAAAFLLVWASPAGWRTFHAGGVWFRYPPGWVATRAPLTAVTSPKQVIALASYRFAADVALADGCEPKEAIDLLPANGVFIYGWEYGRVLSREGLRPSDFPPRPAHFALADPSQDECLGGAPGFRLRFSDNDLAFQVEVVIGRHASASTRADALQALDSFHAG
jgi:hypothetical protein